MKAILKFWTLLLCVGLVASCCDDSIAPELPDNGDENAHVEQPDDPNDEPGDPQEYPLVDGSIFNIQITDDIMATVGTGDLTDIKYANGRYVAIFYNDYPSYVAYSSDGNSWTQVPKEITLGGRLYPGDELKWVNGLYFVIGGSSSFKYSTNGITWNSVDALYVPKAFFKNKYYCVGGNSVWYTQTSSISSTVVKGADLSKLGISTAAKTCDAEVFNNKLFCCTGQGDLVVSSNGTDFTLVGRDFPHDGQFILGDGILVLVGRSSSSSNDDGAFYTTDGVTWTKGNGCNLYGGSGSYRVIVDYYNGVFLVYGRSNNYYKDLYYSLDGKNWNKVALSGISYFTACCLSR